MNDKNLWAPIYDADRREVSDATIDDLENVGVVFNTYGVSSKEKITFDANPQFKKQAPFTENGRSTYLMSCYRNKVKSWINPMFFLRTDIERKPIYPKWAELGGAKEVAKMLIKMKSIEGGEEFSVDLPGFNRDRSARYVTARDKDNNVILNEDGTPKQERARDTRPFPALPDPIVE